MNPSVPKIGGDLITHAETANFSARGILGELFPFIVQAANRMSTRAISKWLDEKHGVQITAVSIARALRSPDKYWQAFAEYLAPAVEDLHFIVGSSPFELLSNESEWQRIREGKVPKYAHYVDPEAGERVYKLTTEELQDRWFILDRWVREKGIQIVANEASLRISKTRGD